MCRTCGRHYATAAAAAAAAAVAASVGTQGIVLYNFDVQEVEKEVDDEEGGGGRKGGRKRKIEVLEYHYERDMEGGYHSCGSMWWPSSKELLSCHAAAAPMPPVHNLQPPNLQ